MYMYMYMGPGGIDTLGASITLVKFILTSYYKVQYTPDIFPGYCAIGPVQQALLTSIRAVYFQVKLGRASA